MADFGSNFSEAFAAAYGLGLKRRQIEGEEKRANAQEKRAQETHDVQMREAQMRQDMHDRLGAAGNVLDNPNDTNGLMSAQAYKAWKQGQSATPQTQGTPATALPITPATMDATKQPMVKNPDGSRSTVSTMGFDIDGKYINLPTITPDGKRLTPAEAVAEYRKTGRHLGIYNNRAEGDAAAQALHLSEEKRISAIPDASGAPATQAAEQPDYVPVIVGNNIMYAPSTRVKTLDGPQRIRAQAEAIGSIDPVVGAQLTQSANAIEGQNLELNSKRYAQGVLNAMRTAETDLGAGLGMLRDAYNQGMPDLGNVEFTRQKDGSIKVDNYVDTSGGRKLLSSKTIPAKDPETGLSAKDNLFRYALSLGSPDAYRQNIMDSSTLATQTLQRVLNVREDRRQEEQLGISRARLNLDRQIAASEGGGQSFNAATLQKVQVGKNEDGTPIYGQVQVRSAKKGGGMQQLVSIPEGDFWLPFGSNGYNYSGAYQEMRNYAAKKGYGMGVNSQGFYMQKPDGTKIPMNRSDLQRYRFGK